MSAKDKHRAKILEILGDPDVEFPNRKELALALGLNPCTLYKHFTPDEITALEKEGLELRRTKYANWLGRVDTAMLRKAAKGDSVAAKLAYQRFEAWSEKQKHEHTGKDGGPIKQEMTNFPGKPMTIKEWEKQVKESENGSE